jgi:hypothetical protein
MSANGQICRRIRQPEWPFKTGCGHSRCDGLDPLSTRSGHSLERLWQEEANGNRSPLMSPGTGFAGPSSLTSLRPVPIALVHAPAQHAHRARANAGAGAGDWGTTQSEVKEEPRLAQQVGAGDMSAVGYPNRSRSLRRCERPAPDRQCELRLQPPATVPAACRHPASKTKIAEHSTQCNGSPHHCRRLLTPLHAHMAIPHHWLRASSCSQVYAGPLATGSVACGPAHLAGRAQHHPNPPTVPTWPWHLQALSSSPCPPSQTD